MANTKSARKRAQQNERDRLRNRVARSALRTEVKRFRAAVREGDAERAGVLLRQAQAMVDRTAKRGIIHDKTAARYVARLARAHQALAASN
jgi:small subunit ribosomal protein S20